MTGPIIVTDVKNASRMFKVNRVQANNTLLNNKEEKLESRRARNFPEELCKEKHDNCEYERGLYWALRDRLYKKDLEGAEKIVSKLAKKTLNMTAGYSGQDRYYGLGAGAIAMYLMHEEKDIARAIEYLEGAFSIAHRPKAQFKSENKQAKLAIIEVAAAGGIAFKNVAPRLALEAFEKDSFSMGIAMEKIKKTIPYKLPDY